MYLIYLGVNITKIAPTVLLCLVLVSVIYGYSVAFSASLNTQNFEKHDSSDALVIGHRFISAQKSKSPTGDVIDDPRPN